MSSENSCKKLKEVYGAFGVREVTLREEVADGTMEFLDVRVGSKHLDRVRERIGDSYDGLPVNYISDTKCLTLEEAADALRTDFSRYGVREVVAQEDECPDGHRQCITAYVDTAAYPTVSKHLGNTYEGFSLDLQENQEDLPQWEEN